MHIIIKHHCAEQKPYAIMITHHRYYDNPHFMGVPGRHSRFTLEVPGSLWNGYTAYTEKLLCTLKINFHQSYKLYV